MDLDRPTANAQHEDGAPDLEPARHVAGRGGPPFWEEWRGLLPDEEIEFVRVIFEDFCGSWD